MPFDIDVVNKEVLEVTQRIFEVRGKYETTLNNIKSLESSLSHNKEVCSGILKDVEIMCKSSEILRQVLDKLSAEGINRLKDLVSYGLKTIFEDHNYELDIELSDRGNVKTADFILKDVLPEGKIISVSLRDACGGGIQCVVSVILRVFFCVFMGYRRILVFDESLSQLSTTYIDGLFSFLRYVIEELHFKILFVTHDPRFLPFADKVYRIKRGQASIESDKNLHKK